MNKTLYLNCFSGISGDMMLGLLLDLLGKVDINPFLKGLALEGYVVEASRSKKGGISGVDVRVRCDEKHCHRGLKEVLEVIEKSDINPEASHKAETAFRLLAEAEGAVHGMPPESVHFHEVGAVDSIVDIVGSCILMDVLAPGLVISSPVNVGSGTVKCAHGELPVPAPATMKLLEGIPVFSRGQPMERTTPTGAVLLKTFVDSFGTIPPGVVERTGYGLGDKDSDIANVLQGVLLGESIFTFTHVPGENHCGEIHEDHEHIHHHHDHSHPHIHEHEHEHEHVESCKSKIS